MPEFNKYIGKVIENNDTPFLEGKVKLYIEHLHRDIPISLYPWGRQDRDDSSDIPEIDDYVWCWFEKPEYWRDLYYGSKISLKNYHEHNETIGSITSVYPDVKYNKYANGISIAISSNSDTPEISIYHPKAEIYINSDGKISIQSSGTDAVSTESMVLGETLKTQLELDLDAMTELQTAINGWTAIPNDGGAALKIALAGFLSKTMANYSDILSTLNKNN